MESPPKLGRLSEVSLRKVWDSEPYSFTPWLAQPENLQFLAESLELPGLELVRTEHPVDSYSADIVCKIVGTETFAVIENQLERTDHMHLGQVLTYTAKFDARVIIWIARQFTDAHRAALDWLNRISSDNYGFFGVEVRAVKIGDSEPAPMFDVVSLPNDWTKPETRSAADTAELTKEHTESIEFWNALDDDLAKRGLTERRTKRPVKGQNFWLPLTSDASVYIVCYRAFSKKPCIGVYLGFYGAQKDIYWEGLPERLKEKEAIVGSQLRIDINATNSVYKVISDPYYLTEKTEERALQVTWLVDEINRFVEAFGAEMKAKELQD